MDIIITAVICTYNREAFIRKAVESLLGQTLDGEMYEIIVVDNYSTDDTAKIIKSMDPEGRNLRYFLEENIGLSYARNTGLRYAKGRYVAFLDDDAEASSTWLANIIACFEGSTDDVCSVGGPVEAAWEISPPKWLSPAMKRALAIVDWGDQPRVLGTYQWLAGVNVAYKKTILEICGGFNTSLGRKGKDLLSMEEAFLREQLEEKGKKSFYHPHIKVKHHIPRERLKRAWFLKRSYWQGVSDAVTTSLRDTRHLTAPSKNRYTSSPGSRERNHRSFFDYLCFIVKQVGYARERLIGKRL